MKTTSMRNERRMAGWLVLWCMGLLAMAVSSCDSELDVQQQYPFTVETMPVPKQLAKGETAEIRCEVKSEGDFDGTVYTIRYFQYDGTGSLKLENGTVFKPNDRYLLEDAKFRLYYTSQCDEAQNLVVVVENNWEIGWRWNSISAMPMGSLRMTRKVRSRIKKEVHDKTD